MFNKDITIVHKTIKKHSPQYDIYHTKGFWSEDERYTLNGTDLTKNYTTIVRILLKDLGNIPVKNDDYIIKGKVSSFDVSNPMGTKISMVSVKDYGSQDMQHIEISGY